MTQQGAPLFVRKGFDRRAGLGNGSADTHAILTSVSGHRAKKFFVSIEGLSAEIEAIELEIADVHVADDATVQATIGKENVVESTAFETTFCELPGDLLVVCALVTNDDGVR